MARYTDASCRLCRREGEKLFLKGARCYSDKCAVSRRAYAPGQHGQAKKKQSEYSVQLREKQKAKRYYGILESQFHKYFEMASKQKGVTGEELLTGLGTSRAEARQLVTHGHFTVNGKRVDIPSYIVSAGDEIALCEKSRSSSRIDSILDVTGGRVIPEWINFDSDKLSAKVAKLPCRADIDFPIEEHLIVELYSK